MNDVTIGTWDHRIVKRNYNNGEAYYGVYEVYYNNDGKPNGVTEDASDVTGENLKDLKEYHKMMEGAFKQPILEYGDL